MWNLSAGKLAKHTKNRHTVRGQFFSLFFISFNAIFVQFRKNSKSIVHTFPSKSNQFGCFSMRAHFMEAVFGHMRRNRRRQCGILLCRVTSPIASANLDASNEICVSRVSLSLVRIQFYHNKRGRFQTTVHQWRWQAGWRKKVDCWELPASCVTLSTWSSTLAKVNLLFVRQTGERVARANNMCTWKCWKSNRLHVKWL